MTELLGSQGPGAHSGAPRGLRMRRIYTTPGVHPYDEVNWERRDVVMTNWRDGSVNFEQRGVEFPGFWTVNAANIVTTKYFRGALGTERREWSLKQLVDRVVGVYVKTGMDNGYFANDEDAEIFDHELKYALIHQIFSFNSPVWFNVGTQSPNQVSACFILAVDDTMESILDWYKEEGLIFKGGSGSGLNLSRIRSSHELLSSGGTASGPVSFMRGADASAGTIKSGGATRRAAKMVVLDVDHPDVREFIETKSAEEKKIRALSEAGFDMDLGGADMASVQYQNANNSVRVTDEFMRAVEAGDKFGLRARTTGEVIEEIDAGELHKQMARAAWECADPGVQYDDTINDWHTTPESGRITASNPCFPGDQRVVTDKGLVAIGDMVKRAAEGESFAVYTNDVTAAEDPSDQVNATAPTAYMVTGTNEVWELTLSDGSRLRCTPNHRLWTENRGWVRADELQAEDAIVRSFRHAPRPMATEKLPEQAVRAGQAARGRGQLAAAPEKWDTELAHYLGWLVGDGCLTDVLASAVYGSPDDREHVLPRHHDFLTRVTGVESKPSVQENGTQQLRVGRAGWRDFLAQLGVSRGRAKDKKVPDAIYEAPEWALREFLRGLYDADGCVVNQTGEGTRYVGLGSRSRELLLGVQELLASLGMAASLYEVGRKRGTFNYTRKDGTEVTYGSDGPSFDLRISGRSIRYFEELVGFFLPVKREKLSRVVSEYEHYGVRETVGMVYREFSGFETTYNLTEPRNHSYITSGVVVANCSEYLHLDNSSCNLASLNLLKFLNDDGSFDTESFSKLVELVITAMDISVSFADFPTEKIGDTTRAFRQLGIGYANLGALLMATGHAYDSDGGRAVAAGITSLMTGAAYKRSAEVAGAVGPYEGYARNAESHQRVMRKHAAASDDVRPAGEMDRKILEAAGKAWREGNEIGEKNGWRNAQASVLAPTGTIGLAMSCDTTGIEPDLALVKQKKLVGGGSMQIVNQTIPRALERLGYQQEQVEAIVEYIAEHGHVIDAPGLRTEHYEVFDCAMGQRSIAAMGHVRMVSAVQPFLSGSASKTINLPESATVEDIEDVYLQGWKLGLKALAVYRDNCKVGQPLSVSKREKEQEQEQEPVQRPVRKRLPKNRAGTTTSFSVGGAEGYMTANVYEDNGLGEVFLKMSKQGSTLAGMMDAFSVAISVGLQYGVPLETFVEKFTNMRFEPSGMTDDKDVRMATSMMDYIFRRLALDHLPYEERSARGIHTVQERSRALETGSYESTPAGDDSASLAQSAPVEQPDPESGQAERPTSGGSSTEVAEARLNTETDAPLCLTCGTKMRPAGSCYVCEGCGSTSGCS